MKTKKLNLIILSLLGAIASSHPENKEIEQQKKPEIVYAEEKTEAEKNELVAIYIRISAKINSLYDFLGGECLSVHVIPEKNERERLGLAYDQHKKEVFSLKRQHYNHASLDEDLDAKLEKEKKCEKNIDLSISLLEEYKKTTFEAGEEK